MVKKGLAGEMKYQMVLKMILEEYFVVGSAKREVDIGENSQVRDVDIEGETDLLDEANCNSETQLTLEVPFVKGEVEAHQLDMDMHFVN